MISTSAFISLQSNLDWSVGLMDRLTDRVSFLQLPQISRHFCFLLPLSITDDRNTSIGTREEIAGFGC